MDHDVRRMRIGRWIAYTATATEWSMLLVLLASCAGTPVIQAAPSAWPDRDLVDAPTQSRADWTVDCNGGADFTTISEAIDAASDNEWIEVAPCTYTETVDFRGKSVWISSTDGPETTIIDANRSYGVAAYHGEGDGAALVGFTIINGRGAYGTVYVSLAALHLEDVIIDGSRGAYTIYGASADVELKNVTLVDTNASSYNLYLWRGAFIIDGINSECSPGTAAFMVGHGSFFLDHADLSCASGYAIYNENAVGVVQRSTLKGQIHAETDKDHYDDTNSFENTVIQGSIAQTYGTLVLRNSILDGGSITGADLYELKLQSSVVMNTTCAFTSTWSGTDTNGSIVPTTTVEYNDLYGLTKDDCDGTAYVGDNGNIDVDPKFRDAGAGDFSTLSGSPLIDAGLDDDAYDDPDGSRNDIGIYGGPRSIGGGW